ncbi:hypothetical protein [Streptomyces sp. NPDC059788]|uniref:hypothetical protein n=1 Tax=Streptomyces sp. NPDC059788 TaxID=3346948 RepID=UPI00365FBE7B
MRKVSHLRETLGYDEVVLRGAGPAEEQLRRAAPDGIDVLLDTVGGEQLRGRGGAGRAGLLARGDPQGDVAGLSLYDHSDLPREWMGEFGRGLRDGSLTFPHTRLRGLDRAPRALCELTRGCHTGAVPVEV